MFLATQSPSANSFSLVELEAAFSAVAVALCFAAPKLGSGIFARIERSFIALAQHKTRSIVVVGLAALLIRLAILPILPIPMPFGADDFSNLLASDTFTHGRLANPTPAMWIHFESIHIDMLPTYMSMYFPAQGLELALGKILFGNPWFGVMIGGALMCSALCWMLQAWLPPTWALLGGFLAVMRLALFSYWTSTYHSAGPICAIGGALVLGGLPRFKRSLSSLHLATMALGAVMLALSRPYEGLLLCLPVVVVLLRLVLSTKRLAAPTLLARTAPALALLAVGIGWLGYYDYRAFGSPTTLPYTINRATYATAPYYVWQGPRPEPHYRHAEMRRFYKIDELDDYNRNHSVPGFFKMTIVKAVRSVYFFTGMALIPPLFMLPWALRDRRIRFLVIAVAILAAGMTIEIYLFPHYLAPFTAALYAIGLQAMRHLYVWTPGNQPVGRALTHAVVAICVLMAGLRLFNQQLHCPVPERPLSVWILNWFGPDHFVPQRSIVENRLKQVSGGQLAFVRYGPDHDPLDEWVFNSADIDSSKIIWAQAMEPESDLELIHYYGQRKAWLVQPDSPSQEVVPYPVPQQVTTALSR
ncbi:MAG TPA: hypothetical protein VGF82_27085 [Terracidiphilus sp.]